MKVLGLDTSTLMTTCGVIHGDKLIGEYSLSQDMSHSEKLVPMIKEVLEGLNLTINDIDIFGVATGPGSFTGLRIGLATVKAFAHLTNKPIVGVSTLEALAFNLPYNDIVVPMIDARRDRVYTAIYKWEGNSLEAILEPCILEVEELLDILDRDYNNIVVNGDGSIVFRDIIYDRLKGKVRFSTTGQNMCKASSICELALLKYNKNEVDDFYTLAPDYLIETQAQRELRERGK
ncbi:tRNA (adenosine(37)-N6)-threonylcarbamoyltransferase complex dimerization subunit type 1 TsaB [Tissierella sp. Yu-01]|uniref:tRNA (adenosine(37)-N6)-threonylcarbamoyltransferase complex dimerization subunit type 1 TsaB n=1 Tax=Tissierella sp. Yu-01 TaxID=3035694 RepID=UPI00240E1F98|nr:tRNA (adenosine(37)-N6)-threonylcarbamoyltransferase complex dimerization subunit type 1 TsaB [Tissierella sp. Yu-01]WFA08716.1 tRNA (adenosine(37)-N6)-threonylcarbamoyltransferase complex dimerization subunit type 1 TsaB [Tissierella sp. Yu-01]